jgi:hypothetical protein
MIHPDPYDVIVRPRRDNPLAVYLVGTPTAPDQYLVKTRDEAVAQAVAFAEQHQVRAWLDEGDGATILLGTFRADDIKAGQ